MSFRRFTLGGRLRSFKKFCGEGVCGGENRAFDYWSGCGKCAVRGTWYVGT